VARATVDPRFADSLKEREIVAEHAERLLTLVQEARSLSADTLQIATATLGATRSESKERAALLDALREIQAAARQKHAATKPTVLRDYGIGARLTTRSFSSLIGIAEAVLEKLTDEALPGITDARKQLFADALSAYRSADAAQGGNRRGASALKTRRDSAIDAVKSARRTIQFAADAAWPYTG
jgi:hypothetical protein